MINKEPQLSHHNVLIFLFFFFLAAFYAAVRIYHSSATEVSPFFCHDLYKEFYQIYDYAASEIRAGNFPLWNPWQSCGLPFLATHQGGLFYPLNAIYLVMPTHTAMAVSFVLHLFLAGVFTYICARGFGISRYGSTIAALTFMFAGHITYHLAEPGNLYCAAWTPLMLHLTRRACDRPTIYAMVLLAFFSAVQFMAGFEQHYVYTLYLMFGYVIFFLFIALRKREAAHVARSVIVLAGAGIITVGLVAIQMLPTYEMAQYSTRPASALRDAQILGLRGWLSLGTGFEMTGWNFLLSLLDPSRGMLSYSYMGILPLLFLPFAIMNKSQRALVVFLCSMILFCFVVAMVDWGGWRWVLHIPTVPIFRVVYRILFIAALCFGLLAGIGWDRLRTLIPAQDGQPKDKSTISLLLVWLIPVWLIWQFRAQGVRTLYVLLAFFFVGLAVARSRRSKFLTTLCQAALLLTVCADLISGCFKPLAFPARNPEIFDRFNRTWTYLREHQNHYRTFFKFSLFDANHVALAEKYGQLKRVFSITDYEPLASQRLADYASYMEQTQLPEQTIFYGQMYNLHPDTVRMNLLNLMSTRFFLIYKPYLMNDELACGQKEWWMSPPAAFQLVHEEPDIRLYENPLALPRAFVTHEFRMIQDEKQLLHELDAPGFDPSNEVLLSEHPELPHYPPTESLDGCSDGVSFTRDEPEHIELEVCAGRPGFLVLLDTDYPGWKATVNGKEKEIYRADYLFRAVSIGAGESGVIFEYQPASFRWGMLITLITIAATGFLVSLPLLWPRRKQELHEAAVSPVEESPVC